MNNKNNIISRHLTEDEILMAIVDETDLGSERQTHLSTCSRCNGEKRKIEQQLYDLSHIFEQMAPVPTRSFRLPGTNKDRSNFRSRWRWLRPVLGVAAAVALVIILVWPQVKFYLRTHFEKNVMTQDVQQDNQLIAQVDVLVNDALPMKYQDILGADETKFDQDFMQYIVPPIEDNVSKPISYNQKGAIS
jgi:hypothetical protein